MKFQLITFTAIYRIRTAYAYLMSFRFLQLHSFVIPKRLKVRYFQDIYVDLKVCQIIILESPEIDFKPSLP